MSMIQLTSPAHSYIRDSEAPSASSGNAVFSEVCEPRRPPTVIVKASGIKNGTFDRRLSVKRFIVSGKLVDSESDDKSKAGSCAPESTPEPVGGNTTDSCLCMYV
jgi:hypothetical protein